jgi:hypothetical protein
VCIYQEVQWINVLLNKGEIFVDFGACGEEKELYDLLVFLNLQWFEFYSGVFIQLNLDIVRKIFGPFNKKPKLTSI